MAAIVINLQEIRRKRELEKLDNPRAIKAEFVRVFSDTYYAITEKKYKFHKSRWIKKKIDGEMVSAKIMSDRSRLGRAYGRLSANLDSEYIDTVTMRRYCIYAISRWKKSQHPMKAVVGFMCSMSIIVNFSEQVDNVVSDKPSKKTMQGTRRQHEIAWNQ